MCSNPRLSWSQSFALSCVCNFCEYSYSQLGSLHPGLQNVWIGTAILSSHRGGPLAGEGFLPTGVQLSRQAVPGHEQGCSYCRVLSWSSPCKNAAVESPKKPSVWIPTEEWLKHTSLNMAAALASLPCPHGSATLLETPPLPWEVSSCLCSLQSKSDNLHSSWSRRGRELFPPRPGHSGVVLKHHQVLPIEASRDFYWLKQHVFHDCHVSVEEGISLPAYTCLRMEGWTLKHSTHVLTFALGTGGEATKSFCCCWDLQESQISSLKLGNSDKVWLSWKFHFVTKCLDRIQKNIRPVNI